MKGPVQAKARGNIGIAPKLVCLRSSILGAASGRARARREAEEQYRRRARQGVENKTKSTHSSASDPAAAGFAPIEQPYESLLRILALQSPFDHILAHTLLAHLVGRAYVQSARAGAREHRLQGAQARLSRAHRLASALAQRVRER